MKQQMEWNKSAVFDANIGLGRFAAGMYPALQTADELLGYLDRAGIGEALVYSVLARECGPDLGNRLLRADIAGRPRLHPCLTLVPEALSLDAALVIMRRENISCGRVFPRAGHFPVRPWCLAGIAESLLQQPHPLLFVDYETTHWSDESIDWEGIRDLCQAYPALPVAVVGPAAIAPRLYVRLLEECPNLNLEISRLNVPGELERLCRRGFGTRLLFGSNSPVVFAGGVLSQTALAALSDADRQNILGANLRRLLGLKPVSSKSTQAFFTAYPAIDMHVHYGRWQHSYCGPGDADGMIGEMNRCGIDKAVLTSIDACYGAARAGNAEVAAACRRYPERLFGYITVDPKHQAEIRDEIKLYGENPSFRGFKFHADVHNTTLADEGYAAALEYADRRGWPILIHAGDKPAVWRNMCVRYPNAKFLAAHAGGINLRDGVGRELADACRDHPNLFLDLGSSRMVPGVVEWLVKTAGIDRVIYGSDYPIFDFGYERGRVDCAALEADEQQRVLYGNAAGLLRLQ